LSKAVAAIDRVAAGQAEDASSPPSALIVSPPIVPVSVSSSAVPVIVSPAGADPPGIVAGHEIGVGEVADIGVLEDDERLPVRAAGRRRPGPIRARCRRRLLQPQEARAERVGAAVPAREQAEQRPSSPESRNMSPPAPAVKSVTVIAAVPWSA
jgi:hypothetical protein